MYKILHYISKVNTFIFILCVLYFCFKYTIGFIINIFFEKSIIFEVLYIFLSIVIITKYIKISSPYQKYLK